MSEVRRLPDADRLRWADQQGWHLTMAFYGEVDEVVLPELSARLGRAAARHQPPTVRLAGGGRFGDRALWVGMSEGRPELERLAASATAAGRRVGIPMEGRPFHGHLTLARTRNTAATRLRPFADALASFQGTSWVVTSLLLMRSDPGEVGQPPRYSPVGQWPLGREPGPGVTVEP